MGKKVGGQGWVARVNLKHVSHPFVLRSTRSVDVEYAEDIPIVALPNATFICVRTDFIEEKGIDKSFSSLFPTPYSLFLYSYQHTKTLNIIKESSWLGLMVLRCLL